jgi:uncharacterized protein (DUF433 family)
MSAENAYVRLDEHGVYRVGSTRVMLDSVLAAFHRGHSPETIRQQYPSLRLEDVYGSIAHYLAHREEIDAYLRRQEELCEEARARSEQQPNPVVARLRAQLRAGVPAEQVRGMAGGSGPPPDDATVRRWIEEHREEKYR